MVFNFLNFGMTFILLSKLILPCLISIIRIRQKLSERIGYKHATVADRIDTLSYPGFRSWVVNGFNSALQLPKFWEAIHPSIQIDTFVLIPIIRIRQKLSESIGYKHAILADRIDTLAYPAPRSRVVNGFNSALQLLKFWETIHPSIQIDTFVLIPVIRIRQKLSERICYKTGNCGWSNWHIGISWVQVQDIKATF